LHAILTPFLSFFLSSLFDMVLFGVPLIFLISFSIFFCYTLSEVEKDEGEGQLQKKGGGRFFFFSKKTFLSYLRYYFWGNMGSGVLFKVCHFIFFSTIPQSLPVSCFLKRD